MKSTPVIVTHTLVSGKSSERILHNGVSYSVRAYQLLVVDQTRSSDGSSEIQSK